MPTFALGEELVAAWPRPATGPRSPTSTRQPRPAPRTTCSPTSPTRRPDRSSSSAPTSTRVVEGPGINDNGCGSATILEIAEQMAKLRHQAAQPRALRLLGRRGGRPARLRPTTSTSSATPSARQIALNLNFDMLGSPNYVRFVYDGDGSRHPDAGAGPRARTRSSRSSPTTSPARAWRRSRRRSTAAPTTARSSTSASRPAACSPAPRNIKTRRAGGHLRRNGRAAPTTRATTRRATPSNNLNRHALDELGDAAAHATLHAGAAEEVDRGDSSAVGCEEGPGQDREGVDCKRLARSFDYRGSHLFR